MAQTKRYITRKSCKECGVRTSALAITNASGSIMPGSPVYYHPRTGDLVINCRGCGVAKYATMVRGTYSAKHICSGKCLASTGFVCECSCGGKNHGAGHA